MLRSCPPTCLSVTCFQRQNCILDSTQILCRGSLQKVARQAWVLWKLALRQSRFPNVVHEYLLYFPYFLDDIWVKVCMRDFRIMTLKILSFLISSAVEPILNILQHYFLHFSPNLHKIRYGWSAKFIKNFIKICTVKAILWSGGNRCNRSAHNALRSYASSMKMAILFLDA